MRKLLALSLVALGFFGAACGSEEDDSGSNSNSNSSSNRTPSSSSTGGSSSTPAPSNSNSPPSSTAGTGSTSTGSSCATESDCPTYACACNDGFVVNARGCDNGRCEGKATLCPWACEKHTGY